MAAARPEDQPPAVFVDADLREARFVRTDLSGAVMRAVDVTGADVDAPWLLDGGTLHVNGVDVVPFVDAEPNHRFPGRSQRRAGDPDGLRAAWTALERTWAATLERVAAMPAGTVDVCVDGERSLAQTLRHLVTATDTWLRRAVLGVEQPHPVAGGARGPGGPRRDGARAPRDRHGGRPGRSAAQPLGPRAPRERPLVPAHDPRGGVGTPPLRRPRPRRDRGGARGDLVDDVVLDHEHRL